MNNKSKYSTTKGSDLSEIVKAVMQGASSTPKNEKPEGWETRQREMRQTYASSLGY